MNVLITGANRGIGLALTQQYLSRTGVNVLAAVRNPTPEIKATRAEIIPDIDVSRPDNIEKLKGIVGDRKLDVLINNAGVFGMNSLEEMNFPSIEQQFQVNAVAPLRVTQALLDNMKDDGGKLLFISSMMASMADNDSGGMYGYRMSKAALNAAARSLAHDLQPRGIHVGLVHPGFVKTQMANFQGEITPEESAAGIIKIVDALDAENSGGFWDWNGEVRPW